MTITRANLETLLVKRCGSLMSLVDMAVTIVGTNTDLNDPLGYALRWGGYSVTDITSVANADIAEVEDADIDMILDVSELRLLQNIQGNYTLVDITNGPESEKFSQTMSVIEKRIAKLSAHVDQNYYSDENNSGFSISVSREDAYSE